MARIITILLALSLVVIFALWMFGPSLPFKWQSNKEPVPVTLNIWTIFEDEEMLKSMADEYRKSNPHVTINVTTQNQLNYRSRVQTKISEKSGPDIFMIHNTWVPMFLSGGYLSAAPNEVMSYQTFQQSFYPLAVKNLTFNEQIYSLPLGYDGLGLFVNEDLLNSSGATIPVTWNDFILSASKMAKPSPGTDALVQVGGAAFGSTNNVDYWSDLIGLLFFQQPGANIEIPNTPQGGEVLNFYTSTVRDQRYRVWDQNMDNSTRSFAQGKVGFYFGTARQVQEIKKINPSLRFKVVQVPQVPGKTVTWGRFWTYGVSATSPAQLESWKFLNFLTSRDGQKMAFKTSQDKGIIPQLYSRIELQGELANDPQYGAFLTQAPNAVSWYLADGTQDGAINDEMIHYFTEAVEGVLKGQSGVSALDGTATGITEVLGKYISPAR